jgi:hypothetical protein
LFNDISTGKIDINEDTSLVPFRQKTGPVLKPGAEFEPRITSGGRDGMSAEDISLDA